MSKGHKKLRFLLGMILAAFSLTACGLSGGPESGKVIDASTNKPVEGVIVVARWIGHLATWAHGSTNCYHVESTTTDGNGEFHIPKWKKDYTEDWQRNVSPRYVDVTVYKPGYQQTLGDAERQSDKNVIYYLEPFKGAREERLKYLLAMSGNCFSEEFEQLTPLIKALYQEAKHLAITGADSEIVNSLHYSVDVLELGWNEANRKRMEGAYDD